MCEEHRTESALEPTAAHRRGQLRPCKPAEARRVVERAVTERCRAAHTPCDAEALSDALLVASELTTNAILHGGGITDFQVDVVGLGVRVSVSDRSDELPVAITPVDEHGRRRVGGRGWPIVCRLAHDVRVTGLPTGGKCITAVVPLSVPVSA
ncbi:ATP-binding protein [Streptomyces sp. NL15-2K]|uniref:ATP-binding protein n=1 Tax=Streptomyces sp. NL15-2K TaxID=376149 RepID=UPI000F55B5EA|nr:MULTISPECIES: ATP-binding protein [Actinomycetes]WKX15608.1 ATP-binding protein [Kutzneria buriramensis]